jgi:hypothetical protein
MALRGRSPFRRGPRRSRLHGSEVWFEVIRPALADKQGWALIHLHPRWHRQLVLRPLVLRPMKTTGDWKRWCFTTIEGGNVPPEEVEAARAQLDARTFRQEFEASFENLSGLVAISFNDANIDKEVRDLPVLPLLLGVDFNVDPMSGICAVKKGDDSGSSTKSS